jgi:hypothetical protein
MQYLKEIIMKKIIITLAALAAVSTASLAAGNRNSELPELANRAQFEQWTGSVAVTERAPLAAPAGIYGMSNFDKLNRNSYNSDHGGH